MQDFAKKAIFSKSPAELGSRCTVFMNSSVKQAQKDGAETEDISAGLARSVVKNAIFKVIRARDVNELGKHIVVQGGTFLNDAVLRSFEQEIGREVLRPEISELMGAYGAALYGKKIQKEKSKLLNLTELENFQHISSSGMCKLCTNHCQLTINTFTNGQKFISGNKCERGAGKKLQSDLPNMVAYKNQLFNAIPLKGGGRARIGLPRVLNIYEMLPFWAELFRSLNCDVVLSSVSNRKIYMKGQNTIPSDTVCYPAKLVHGHIIDLLEKDLDAIFYPCMSYTFDEGISDNCYNCPIVAYYPELIQANIPDITKTHFLYPHLGIENHSLFAERMYEEFKNIIPKLSKKEMEKATENAFKTYYEYRENIRQEGTRILKFAMENNHPVIILASRPYHIDPEINHGLDRLLNSLQFVVVTEDALYPVEGKLTIKILNQWGFHARMYNAAKYVSQHKNMELVHLVSFGCGIDAITTDEIHDILRSNNKLYTQLKIDEVNNLGAAKIRLRSLQATMKEREM